MTDTTLAEFSSSTTLFLLGLVLLGAWPASWSTGQRYVALHEALPGLVWGLACLSIGVIQSVANVARISHGRVLASGAATLLFITIARYDVPVFGTAALVSALVYLKLFFMREEHEIRRRSGEAQSFGSGRGSYRG